METGKRISVVILDNEEHQREGLAALMRAPDIEIVAMFADARRCIEYLRENPADIAVVDLQLHFLGDFSEGVEAIELIREAAPRTRIIVASVSASPRRVMDCFHAGAHAFIHKPAPPHTRPKWSDVIHMVYKGGRYYDMEMVSVLLHYVDIQRLPAADDDRIDPLDRQVNPLTERQVEVLSMAARGMPNAEIAERLVLQPQTVKNHMYQIMGKLKVERRERAIEIARARGFIH